MARHAPSSDFDTSARQTLRRLLVVGAVGVAAALLWIAAGELGRRQAIEELSDRSNSTIASAASVLRSEIDKQRTVPVVLAEDPDVIATLRRPNRPSLDRIDRRLKALAKTTGASVIYLIARSGWAIAASNYDDPQSFVGNDYRFRRYFSAAMRDGQAEQYALGSVSRRPGLYIARRVGSAAEPLGVIVLKVELDSVEETWRAGGGLLFAVDTHGVVLATTEPDLRFRTLNPMPPPERAAIRESLQFGEAPLEPIEGWNLNDNAPFVTIPRSPGETTLFVSQRSLTDPLLPWRLYLGIPADPVLTDSIRNTRILGLATAFALLTPSIYLLRRRRRAQRRERELRDSAIELERRVAERTAEIETAHADLRAEVETRERLETRAGELRTELEQANRLATLGQIAAGVAHEINQPLAAIRTYSENAGAFLERGEPHRTDENLKLVVGLTERIGTITGALRDFSRRGSAPLGDVFVSDAVEGAQMLLANRFSAANIELARDGTFEDLRVHAERIRLEQVLVNLLQNALDAVSETPAPCVTIRVRRDADWVLLSVVDNGPGIDPSIAAKLFTPFSTAKPRGLGLGLVISKDIVAEWGGDLDATSRPGEGAVFTVRLRQAS